MPDFSLSLLGPFVASLDQRPLTRFRTKSAQALLIYLVSEPAQPISRDNLMGLFWPELSQSSAQKRLRDTLYLLRQILPEVTPREGSGVVPFLLSDRYTIQINPAAGYELDVDRFNRLLDEDKAAWSQAVDLYRGDFLTDFYLPDSNRFEEWAAARRASFRQQMFQTLADLASRAIRAGDYTAAEGYARRLLAMDNLRESAHRQLMEVLAGSGRRAEAVGQYETVAKLLRRELDIEPSHQTRALLEEIRSGDGREPANRERRKPVDSGKGIYEAPASPSSGLGMSPRHNLPPQATPFVGRERELAELQAMIADPEIRLVTLLGPGGMGKTRLALACAERLLSSDDGPTSAVQAQFTLSFPNGIYFVDLAPVGDVTQTISAMAQALDFQLRGEANRSAKQQLLDYLRRKQMLLILDNMEHLADGADPLADIMRSAAGIKIMVTSRERLHIQGEHLFAIQGLQFPDSADPATTPVERDLVEYDAVKLFLQGARRVRHDYTIDADDAAVIGHICRLVEGMPLALVLAAAWVDTLSLADIIPELRRSLDFLETETRDIPERHRNIRAVFEASWWRLSEEEQGLLARLSVFRGGFRRPEAQVVAGATLPLLGRLSSQSLIWYNQARDRYQIHELLRQYSAEKLAGEPVAEIAARDSHCRAYCQALQAMESELKGAHQLETLATIADDIDNMRAAWNWAVHRENVERLQQAMNSLCLFYEYRSRFEEGEMACRQAAARIRMLLSHPKDRTAHAENLHLLATLLAWQGFFGDELGDVEASAKLFRESRTLLDQGGLTGPDTRSVRAFTLLKGSACFASLDLQEAKRMVEESLALYRELGDQWGTANALARTLGVPQDSLASIEESLVIRRTLGDRRGIADSLGKLAMANADGMKADGRSGFEEAERLKWESIAILKEIGDMAGVAYGLRTMSSLFVRQGKFTEALLLTEESRAIGDDQGGWLPALSILASCYPLLYLGRYEEAQSRAQEAIHQLEAFGVDNNYAVGLCVDALGRVAMALGTFAKAEKRLRRSVTIYQIVEMEPNVHQAQACLGYVARGLGDSARAQRLLVEALLKATEFSNYHALVHALPGIALILADLGEQEQAVELYALASTQGIVANSTWFEDVAGRHIASVAAALPTETVESARERGRRSDLWQTAGALVDELIERGWDQG